jgi:MazG family protein
MQESPSADIGKLLRLVATLRAPDGCPWDREQTLPDLRAYVIEEAHEVAAAIDNGSPEELCGELGDLLFQVVFLARLAEEAGDFDLAAVIDGIHRKMVERHPHVFGDENLESSDAVKRSWERRKLETRGDADERAFLDGVPTTLPTLTAAYRITQKVAGIGFDWSHPGEIAEKIREELVEVEETLEGEAPPERVKEEIGDLLFAVANLARFLDLDPEAALAAANRKFRRRFTAVEKGLAARGVGLAEAGLEVLDAEWEAVKQREAEGEP